MDKEMKTQPILERDLVGVKGVSLDVDISKIVELGEAIFPKFDAIKERIKNTSLADLPPVLAQAIEAKDEDEEIEIRHLVFDSVLGVEMVEIQIRYSKRDSGEYYQTDIIYFSVNDFDLSEEDLKVIRQANVLLKTQEEISKIRKLIEMANDLEV
jgi:hypothetical protein